MHLFVDWKNNTLGVDSSLSDDDSDDSDLEVCDLPFGRCASKTSYLRRMSATSSSKHHFKKLDDDAMMSSKEMHRGCKKSGSVTGGEKGRPIERKTSKTTRQISCDSDDFATDEELMSDRRKIGMNNEKICYSTF